jgi:glycosyl transferase family 87
VIPWWVPLLATPALLAGFSLRHRHRWLRLLWTGYATALVLAFGLLAARIVWRGAQSPPEWDFKVFWLFGRVASEGVNFYEPHHLQRAGADLEVSESFRREILEVGAWYPPASMLLFLPLGWLELEAAYAAWMLVNGAVLVLDLWLLWTAFYKRDGWPGLLLAAALLALLRPSLATLSCAQTNFLLLLPLLACWRRPQASHGGVLIGLASLVKPVAGALFLVALVRLQWRFLFGAAVTATVAVLASLGIFGTETHLAFWDSPPTERMPPHVYTEDENQSLLATILRALEGPVPEGALQQPLFVVLAAVLTAATAFIARRLPAAELPVAWGLTLALGLIVYPATLSHYGLLLIVPVSWLWSVRAEIPYGTAAAVGLATLVATLLGRTETAFAGFAATWLAFAVLGVRGLRTAAAAPAPAAA